MQEFLHENDRNCFSSDGTKSEESEFRPSSEEEQMDKFEVQADKMGEEMEHRLFVCESMQLMEMVQQINETSKCGTANCNGKIKLFWLAVLYNRIFDLHSQYVLFVTNVVCKRNLVCSAFRT